MPQHQYYIADGAERPLRRIESTRLVSPARGHSSLAVAARLARSSRLALSDGPREGFLVVRGDVDKLAEIESYRDVGSVRSAFEDDAGHELVLTDDILVSFSEELSEAERAEIVQEAGCSTVRKTGIGVWRLRVRSPALDAPLETANRLCENKSVRFAEPNMLTASRPQWRPADPLFANQWHLSNTGQGGGKAGADVAALEAWKKTKGVPSIRIVVHDSGVDLNHPDLAPNLLPGWDFDHEDDDASNPAGPHGTACAGVIGAASTGEGCVGIAPNCSLVPLRAAGAHSFLTWAETFAWSASRGDIISCSWSLGASSTLTDAIVDAAENGRNGRGIPIFFAAGNAGQFRSGIEYPANLRSVFAVGASTNFDERAAYSQFGPGLDAVAPSGGGSLAIETTDVSGEAGYNDDPQGHYCKASGPSGFSGTSSATPLVAGVAALMLSANPSLTAGEVYEILRQTAVKIDTKRADYDSRGWSPLLGFGRIDAGAAVEAAMRARPQLGIVS